ncbi:hypothetical protein [Nocardioides caricicola]|uniref:Uncharacterized protein n=1 Tax=Nocardioides caricicola TaxID=634770 RepID=A0ABW0N5P3_9ACTN
MSNLVAFRIVTPDGANRVVCDIECAEHYLASHSSEDGRRLVTDPVRVTGSCAFCAWDGERVAVPPRCRMHDQSCPDFDALGTLRAQAAVRELRRRTGGDLSPRAFAYLEAAARSYREAGIDGTARMLVERVWDASVDWLGQ